MGRLIFWKIISLFLLTMGNYLPYSDLNNEGEQPHNDLEVTMSYYHDWPVELAEEELEELEEFSYVCPCCGADMEKIDHGYADDGTPIARWCCLGCDENDALYGSQWVYDDGPKEGYICRD